MYDVAIVGARCSGASAAMLLARAGHRVVMIDRDPPGSDMRHSTHIVQTIAISKLRKWGLLPAIEAACRPIERYSLDFGFVHIDGSPPAVDGDARAFCPRRQLIDGILLDAALAAGAEYRPETKVTGVLRDGDRVAGVEVVDRTGASDRIRARVVIGADGPGSTIAQAVGAECYLEDGIQQVAMWSYWEGDHADALILSMKMSGATWFCPCSGGATMVGANWLYADYLAVRHDAASEFHRKLAAGLPQLYERIAGHAPVEPLRTGSTRNFIRKPHGPGWVLLGDAGHKKDPVTAQGITDAFVDVDSCVPLIDAGLRGECVLDDALHDWHAARDARLVPRHHMTIEMARFPAPGEAERALYAAVASDAEETTRFLGLMSGVTDPVSYFAPDRIAALVAGAATS